jgi:hypothetical protein
LYCLHRERRTSMLLRREILGKGNGTKLHIPRRGGAINARLASGYCGVRATWLLCVVNCPSPLSSSFPWARAWWSVTECYAMLNIYWEPQQGERRVSGEEDRKGSTERWNIWRSTKRRAPRSHSRSKKGLQGLLHLPLAVIFMSTCCCDFFLSLELMGASASQ